MPDPALSYQNILDAYRIGKVHHPETFDGMDVQQFSQYMNRSLGTDAYRTGDVGKLGTSLLYADLGLEDVLGPTKEKTKAFGGDVGAMFGDTGRRIGESVGESLPRAGVDVGLLLGGAAAGGVPGLVLGGAGVGSAATRTYSETGSGPAAAVTAATTAAAPFVGRWAGGQAVKYLTPQLEKYIGTSLPRITEGLTREAGEQTGLFGLTQASRQAGSLVQGQGLTPLTPESLGSDIAFNLPFLPLSVPRLARGTRVDYPAEGRPNVQPAGFGDLFRSKPGSQYFNRESEAMAAASGTPAVNAVQDFIAQGPKQQPQPTADPFAGPRVELPAPVAPAAQRGVPPGPIKLQESVKVPTDPAATLRAQVEAQLNAFDESVYDTSAPGASNVDSVKAAQELVGKARFNAGVRAFNKAVDPKNEFATEHVVNMFARLVNGESDIPNQFLPNKNTPKRVNAGSREMADSLAEGIKTQGLEPQVKLNEKTGQYEVTWDEPSGFSPKKVEGVGPASDKVVKEEVTKLSQQGAGTAQVARAAKQLEATPMLPGETLPDAVARETGLTEALKPEADPVQHFLGVYKFFDTLFTKRGLEGPHKEYLTRVAMDMASRFSKVSGNTKLAMVMQGPSFHAPAADPKWASIIGLAKKGIPNQAADNLRVLWDFGHEMAHELQMQTSAGVAKASPSHGAYLNAMQTAATMSTADKALVLNTLIKHALPHVAGDFDYKAQVYEKNPTPEAESAEFLADYLGLVTLGASSKSSWNDFKDYFKFSSPETIDFIDSYVKDISSSFDAYKELLSQESKTKVDVNHDTLLKNVDEIQGHLKTVLDHAGEVKLAETTMRAVIDRIASSPLDEPPVASYAQVKKLFKALGIPEQQIQKADLPDERVVMDEAERSALPTNKDEVGGFRGKWWNRWLPMTQFARLVGKEWYKQGVKSVQDAPGIASKLSYQMWQPWTDKNGKWDAKRVERLGDTKKPIGKAFTELRLFQQAERKSWSNEDVKSFLKQKHPNLTDEEVQTIQTSIQQMDAISKEASLVIERGMIGTMGHTIARIVQQRVPSVDPIKARELGIEMATVAMGQLDGTLDPAAMQQKVEELSQRVGNPLAFQRAMEHATQVAPVVKKHLDNLKANATFTSEVRPGQWLLVSRKASGERALVGLDTQREAQERYDALTEQRKKATAQGLPDPYEYVRVYNKADQKERWRNLPKDIVETYAAADKLLFDQTKEKLIEDGADADSIEQFAKEFKPGDGAFRVFTPPYMQERKLVAGREELNSMEQTLNYIAAVAYGTARREARQQVELISNHPELKTQNPWLQNSLKQYANELLDSGSSEWTRTKNFIFLNTLAFNVSSALINTAQNFMVAAPLLINQGAKFGEAYKLITGASKDLGKAYMETGSIKGPKFKDPELQKLVTRLEEDRVVDKGFIADLFALDDTLAVTRHRMTSGVGGKAQQISDLMAQPGYYIMKAARDFYGVSEQFNQRAAGIAGYRYAKSKGMSEDAAYNFAVDLVKEGNFGGGKYNRPEFFNGLGKAFGTAGLAYSLSGYTFNLLGVYSRLIKGVAERAKGERLTSKESKALATALGAQVLMGGLMGLPLVSGLVAVLDQLFPDAEVKKNIRGAFASLAGSDTEMGHVMSDVGMSGILNAGPYDVGSRFQLGTFLGVDPYKGFEFSNFLGPVGSLVDNFKQATAKATTGDPISAFEKILPPGVRGIAKQLTEEGGLRNDEDKLILEPTTAERIGYGVGFRPKRLSQYYEQQALKLRSEQIEQRARQSLYNNLARSLLQGRTEEVRVALLQEAVDAQKEGGFFDPQEALGQVVQTAQEMTLPADPLRTGMTSNIKQRADIQRLFPQPARPTEMQLLAQRMGMEQSVGIPGAGRVQPARLAEAQFVDQLMEMNPTMTVAEAKLMFRKAMTPRGRRVSAQSGMEQPILGR